MYKDTDKKRGSTINMETPHCPAPLHSTANISNRIESQIFVRGVVASQKDTGQNLTN